MKAFLAWHWDSYPAAHRNRLNLAIHLLAVPLFVAAVVLLVAQGVRLSAAGVAVALGILVLSMLLQRIGHNLEAEQPAPFKGPGDFALRLLTEQFVTFPHFLLSGGWYRNFRSG